MNKYNACIIGAGSIGATKPDKYDSPTTDNILTIAHAFYAHPEITLSCIFDTDRDKAIKAMRKWDFKYYNDIFLSSQIIDYYAPKFDIIACCVPTDQHLTVLKQCIDYKPKLIIAEKPFCNNSEEAQEIIDYNKDNIPIIVDYIRNFDTAFHSTIIVNNDDFGKIYNARVVYTRGLKHEGCHAINMCHKIFGPFQSGTILNSNSHIIDHNKSDPSYCAHLSFDKCDHVLLVPVDGRKYSFFEFEMFTEKQGRIVFSEHGLFQDKYEIIPEPVYGDYNTISRDITLRQPTMLNTALLSLADNACNLLNPNSLSKYNLCTVDDAIEVHKIYESLINNINKC